MTVTLLISSTGKLDARSQARSTINDSDGSTFEPPIPTYNTKKVASFWSLLTITIIQKELVFDGPFELFVSTPVAVPPSRATDTCGAVIFEIRGHL